MKNTKKLFALLLVVVMMLALGTTALAADAALTGHTYTAYQIFSGTQAEGSENLGNIAWGSGISDAGKTALLKFGKAEGADPYPSVAALAAALTDDNAEAFAEEAYKYITGDGVAVTDGTDPQPAGYYLIVDTTANLTGENTVYNLALLQLTKKGTLDIATKVAVPEVEKKVKDINDTEDKDISDNAWQDSADFDINDDVPFQLTATMPGTVVGYDTYKVIFHDTLSKGLKYNEDAVITIYKDGDVTNTAETNKVTVTGVTPVVGNAADTMGAYEDGKTLTWTISDVLSLGATANSKIVVNYTAELTGDAEIGAAGNPNKVYLEYSNNPNNEGEGAPTGKTPEDTVIVFTYEFSVDKVDEEKNPLAGAKFELFKKVLVTPAVPATDTTDAVDAVYNWVSLGNKEATPVYGELPEDAEDGAEKPIVSYTFDWAGLDDGDYKLVESTTPAGYNTMEDLEFTVTAAHDVTADAPTLTDLTSTLNGFNADADTGLIDGDIVNQKGATLPETGGIGTTIFYILGGILLVGAAVLLITKKRMGEEN